MPHRHEPRLTLKKAEVGARLFIKQLDCDPTTCQRLREMGFGESSLIVKMSDQGSVVCLVCGTRVGVSSKLASGIIVEPVPNA
jgi:ferrous iron transport protein A